MNEAQNKNEHEYMTIDEVIKRWRGQIARSTLAVWRCKGKGPAFTKFGKRILYRRESVIAYERQNINGQPS